MKNGKLAILVPSRGRPTTFARFMASWMATTSGASDLILRNGEDDPLADLYAAFEGTPNLIRVLGTDRGFNSVGGNAGYNCAQQDLWERFPDYSAYLSIEDDCILHTPNFDTMLLRMFDDYPGRVACLELYDRSQTIHCPCLSAEWCDALGFLFHPDVGEHGFYQVLDLAMTYPAQFGKAVSVQFTHYPHLREYGYNGDERPGALSQPAVVEAFKHQARALVNWMSKNRQSAKAALMRASVEI
jgi:hypothetical protein